MIDTDILIKKYDELKEDKQMKMISNERLKKVNELKEEIRRLKSTRQEEAE